MTGGGGGGHITWCLLFTHPIYFQNSAVSGPRGLAVGDPVTSISGCRVTDIDDWHTCVSHSIKEESMGHCMSREKIAEMDTTPKSIHLRYK